MGADYEPRTPGQRAWLVGAAGLLTVLMIGGAWLGWRGLSHAPPTLTAAPPDRQAEADEVLPAFGAPELVDGVPWGYGPTRHGALAAAVTAIAVTSQPEVVFDQQRFEQVAAVVFAPEEARVQARQVDMARTELEASAWGRQPPSRRSFFFTPLAAKLIAYDPAVPAATVQVWAMMVLGVGDAGGAVFTTSTVDLVLNPDGDTWTVIGLDSVEGPTPLASTASAPGRTRAFIRDAVPAVPLPLPPGHP